MSLTNLKITFRRLVKERLYTLINIGGLAVGMAAALLIVLYLLFELSFDRYHNDHENIYRIAVDHSRPGEHMKLAINSVPLGPQMVEQFPEFTEFMRIFPSNYFFRNIIYRYEDKNFYEGGIFAVDSTLFDFFDYEFIHGNPHKALSAPFSIVMTESMANRYFDDENPVGKIIQAEGAGSFMVTAVIKDPPLNSHFQFEGLFSLSTMNHLTELFSTAFAPGVSWQMFEISHGSRIAWVYLKTVPGFDPEVFSKTHWREFHDTHIWKMQEGENVLPIFQPVADIHLKSKLEYEMTSETGAVTMMSPELIHIFFIIALFLLIIAAINYTNIAISRFNRRSKEVGVKKVLGAQKGQLIRQFFTESVITTLIALLLALLLAELAIPSVNQLLNVHLSLNIFEDFRLLPVLAGIAVFVGLISGGYPALYFSSFSPIKVLGYRFRTGHKTLTLKKALIVLQFTISIFMIIATLVVGRQLAYINNKDLGYDSEHIVIIELQDNYSRTRAEVLKNDLIRSPYIMNAAVSNYYPSILTMFNSLSVEGENGFVNLSSNVAQVSPDFLEFMGMQMAEGRFFSWDHLTDFDDAVIINEAAQRLFGWDEPIGKEITGGYVWADGTTTSNRKVIGVVKDFHYSTLSRPVDPMVWFPMRNNGAYMNVKISGTDLKNGIDEIGKSWASFRPNSPLQYQILDQVIASMYNSQRVLSIFFASFAWLCIIIAFLGLYGLSAYSVEQRTREIGIRKILGATFADVLIILGKEFFWLIIIAVVLAATSAWYLMSRWLDGFAFNAGLSAAPFVIAVLSAVGVALLAVGVHAYKASRLQPASAIKYE